MKVRRQIQHAQLQEVTHLHPQYRAFVVFRWGWNFVFDATTRIITVMSQKTTKELLKRVTQKIQDFKSILRGLGYSQRQIVTALFELFGEKVIISRDESDESEMIKKLLGSILTKAGSASTGLTFMLVELEVKLLSLEKDQAESAPRDSVEDQSKVEGAKKDKPKKKKNGDKKKSSKTRQGRWEEGRMAVLGAYMQESRDMMNSMRKLMLFKDFLEKQADCKELMGSIMPFAEILA